VARILAPVSSLVPYWIRERDKLRQNDIFGQPEVLLLSVNFHGSRVRLRRMKYYLEYREIK
jgi:hypothetical protein